MAALTMDSWDTFLQSALTAGGVREALVHHGHVFLLCGQNGAPCGQQFVARRSTFDERLKKKSEEKREEKKKKEIKTDITEKIGEGGDACCILVMKSGRLSQWVRLFLKHSFNGELFWVFISFELFINSIIEVFFNPILILSYTVHWFHTPNCL